MTQGVEQPEQEEMLEGAPVATGWSGSGIEPGVRCGAVARPGALGGASEEAPVRLLMAGSAAPWIAARLYVGIGSRAAFARTRKPSAAGVHGRGFGAGPAWVAERGTPAEPMVTHSALCGQCRHRRYRGLSLTQSPLSRHQTRISGEAKR